MRYAVINGEEVVRHGTCQPQNLSAFEEDPGDIAIYTDADPAHCWWDTAQEKLVPKQPHPAVLTGDVDSLVADGESAAEFSDIPTGTRVEVITAAGLRQKEGLPDGAESYRVTSDQAGVVMVIFSGARYLPTAFDLDFSSE